MTIDLDPNAEYYRSFHAEKWVCFYGDYCTDGLWTREGASLEVECLPVPDDLRKRIRGWGGWYESVKSRDAKNPQQVLHDFTEYGLELARELKVLLPDWTIYFHSDSPKHLTPTANREGEVLDDGSFGDLRVLRYPLSENDS